MLSPVPDKNVAVITENANPRRIVIMGAAGRDFHNFNVLYRHDSSWQVVAFTAAQIPGIAGRRYPSALAGPLYPGGIPGLDEVGLATICREYAVDGVVFAYGDVEHAFVMHKASIALAAGADFTFRADFVPMTAVNHVLRLNATPGRPGGRSGIWFGCGFLGRRMGRCPRPAQVRRLLAD